MTSPKTPSTGQAFAVYSLLRMLLFVLVVVSLRLLGLTNGLALLATGVIISAVVGLFALKPQREALARAVAARDEVRRAERSRQLARLEEDPGPPEDQDPGRPRD